jgi:methionyl-tRNA formyltransferase
MARLVFLGTPEAAVLPLRTLVDAGHDVAMVVSRPDRRRGRGSGLTPSPVKAAALELGLEVVDSLDPAVEVGAELGVVVAYGRIIPVAVLERLPMVNLHFSMLPRWRGAAPVERAILEGDSETGVCLMEVEAGLDTGPVYAEADTEIDEEETADELRSRLVVLGCQLLVEYLAGGLRGLPMPQDQKGEPSYAEKVLPAELEIRWDQPAVQIRRVIRLGRAWTTFRGRRLHILRATGVPPGAGHSGPADPGGATDAASPTNAASGPGQLDGQEVICGLGTRVRLVTVQAEGKRPMPAEEWLRGIRPGLDHRLGE